MYRLQPLIKTHGTLDYNARYFMIVNRRCSPVTDMTCGGLKRIKVEFDFTNPMLSGFQRFNSLNLIDVENGSLVTTFDRHQDNSKPTIDLGFFNPAQGKIYKLVPTLLDGGTLAADEDVTFGTSPANGGEYDVNGIVYNGGHKIWIDNPITFNFKENTGIVINGGQFILGGRGYGSSTVRGKNGLKWNGFIINNGAISQWFESVRFYDLKNDNYAIDAVNSILYCSNCTFDNSGNGSNAGGVRISTTGNTITPQHFFGNIFQMGSSGMNAINMVSSPYTSIVQMENNEFYSSGSSISAGIFVNGIAGPLRNNIISGFNQGIICQNSSADIYENTITGGSGSKSVSGVAYSYLNMGSSGPTQLAGYNTFDNSGTNSDNIVLENTTFNLNYGYNSFNIGSSANGEYHLGGYIPTIFGTTDSPPAFQAPKNCFKVNYALTNAISPVTNGYGGPPLQINFLPYYCTKDNETIDFIVNAGNGISDTVYGMGASYQDQLTPSLLLYRQISVNSRKMLYDSVIAEGFNFLNNNFDSTGNLDVVSKLFYASLFLDSNGNKLHPLKTFYETLMLNHPDNVQMVCMLYYYDQRCKAALKDYNAALDGFQQIIIEFPNSYEGLVASWDYMSTYLLDTLSGGGGGESGDDNPKDKPKIRDTFDKTKFNENQRGSIIQNVTKAFEESGRKEKIITEKLKHESDNGNEKAAYYLKVKKALKETIRSKKPKKRKEYISIIQQDINKVYGIGVGGRSVEKTNSVPKVFNLYQNYPNPFNPTATIKYDLPKDVKVLIKVYDILGREVKKLVDEFKKAGSYTVDFNGTNLASGVYFYRIEAGDYVMSKKMVLVK